MRDRKSYKSITKDRKFFEKDRYYRVAAWPGKPGNDREFLKFFNKNRFQEKYISFNNNTLWSHYINYN